jgi:hypothetical protein
MDTKTTVKTGGSQLNDIGIFIRGVVISNRAQKITKKDGSGVLALVSHELALSPGLAVLQRFLDPKENPSVTIEGDEVTKYPELKLFEPVAAKVMKIQDRNGQIVTSSWEITQQG